MDPDFNEENGMIRKIKAMPEAALPPDFTKRIMEKLPEYDRGILNGLRRYVLGLNIQESGKNRSINKISCSFYYFITSLFYLIIGIVSFIFLKNIGSGVVQSYLIAVQPIFAMGMAFWLFVLGLFLLADSPMGVKTARYGTIFYILAAIVNCILIQPYLHIPFAILFILGLAVTSTMMGIILMQAVKKMQAETV